MQNLNRNSHDSAVLPDAASQRLQEDLGEVYRLPVPVMHFDASAPQKFNIAARVRRRWRPALIGAAAAAGLALFVGGPGLFGGSTSEVSAEQIFERTKEVAAATYATIDDESYHLVARSDISGRQDGSTITETWYGDASQQRTETRDAETGEVLFGHVQNGDDFWLYAHVDGKLTATHSSMTGAGFGIAVGGPGLFSPNVTGLADLLNTFTNECTDARSVGEDVIAGRPVYVIEVTSKPDSCKWEAVTVHRAPDGETASIELKIEDGANPNEVNAGGKPVAVSGAVASAGSDGEITRVFVAGGPMRVWIDQETFMTLKSESAFGDELTHSYEVTTLDVGVDLAGDDALFQPPAGAEVVEAGSPEDARTVLKGMFQAGAVPSVEYKIEAVPGTP